MTYQSVTGLILEMRKKCPFVKERENEEYIIFSIDNCHVQIHKEAIKWENVEILANKIWERIMKLDEDRKNGQIN